MDKTRAEYLRWCKDRAMEHIKRGDALEALASMLSDMGQHPETKDHPALKLGVMMAMGGMLNDLRETERFIQGFN